MPRLTAPPSRIARGASRLAPPPGRSRDQQRSKLAPWRKWYNLKRWKDLRIVILTRDLWICQATGVLLTDIPNQPNSAIVDHMIPHRGDPALFWDPENLRSVSKEWHDSAKQSQERGGAGG